MFSSKKFETEVHNAKKEEFLEKVKPITGENAYDDAYAIRDESIKRLELK